MEESVELTGVGGIASTAHGLNSLQQVPRSPAETLDLAGKLSLSLTMCGSISGGCHLTFKLEPRCLHPVNIGLDGFSGQSVIESVTQFCDGLPGEFFSALSFIHPEFQLGTGFRWKLRAGLRVNGSASCTTEAKHAQQQHQGAAA